MKSIIGWRSITHFALALFLIAFVPASLAQPASANPPRLDKHARKIHKRLSRYPSGTYVNVVFRDGSERAGVLSTVNPASFTMTNSDNNVPETHNYMDVANAQKGREFIGEGSERHIHWVRWGIAGAAVAGAAVAAVAVR